MTDGLMPGVAHYRQLIVWQKAMDLVPIVYRLARRLPREEQFGLTRPPKPSSITSESRSPRLRYCFHSKDSTSQSSRPKRTGTSSSAPPGRCR